MNVVMSSVYTVYIYTYIYMYVLAPKNAALFVECSGAYFKYMSED